MKATCNPTMIRLRLCLDYCLIHPKVHSSFSTGKLGSMLSVFHPNARHHNSLDAPLVLLPLFLRDRLIFSFKSCSRSSLSRLLGSSYYLSTKPFFREREYPTSLLSLPVSSVTVVALGWRVSRDPDLRRFARGDVDLSRLVLSFSSTECRRRCDSPP